MNKLNTLVEELSNIALKKKELSDKEEIIKEGLLTEMSKENLTKIPGAYGTVSVSSRKTYTFTDAIKKLEEKTKIKKDDEIKQGLATFKESQFITFRVNNK